MTSLHAILAQNQTNIQTAISPPIIKQFYIVKHQKTQNVELYKIAISKNQNCVFLHLNFQKKINVEKKTIFFTIQYVYNMCVMYVLTTYMPNFKSIGSKIDFISSKSFENVHM